MCHLIICLDSTFFSAVGAHPPGTKLNIGSAVIEVTEAPHTGCAQFVGWFGADAMRFVNSSRGRELCLRGINSKVVQPGVISQGDKITKG